MSDIAERLAARTVLETYENGSQLTLEHPLGKEAAAEILHLRAENDVLKRVIEDDAKLILHIRMEGEKLLADKAAWQGAQQGTADVVKQLEKENEKLRAALKPFADAVKDEHNWKYDINVDDFRAAAAALKETGDES